MKAFIWLPWLKAPQTGATCTLMIAASWILFTWTLVVTISNLSYSHDSSIVDFVHLENGRYHPYPNSATLFTLRQVATLANLSHSHDCSIVDFIHLDTGSYPTSTTRMIAASRILFTLRQEATVSNRNYSHDSIIVDFVHFETGRYPSYPTPRTRKAAASFIVYT